MGGREDENINVVPTQSIIGQGVPNRAETRVENGVRWMKWKKRSAGTVHDTSKGIDFAPSFPGGW